MNYETKTKEKYFTLGLVCYLVFKLSFFNSSLINNVLGALSIILLVISIILEKFRIHEILLFQLLIILSIAIYLYSSELNVVYVILLIISSKSVPIEKILKIFLMTYLVYFLVMIVKNILGIYSEEYVYKYINNKMELVRSYGFGHPNQIGNRFVTFLLMYFFMNRNNYKFRRFAICMILTIVVYNFSLSRTGLFAGVAFCIAYFILSKISIQRVTAILLIFIFSVLSMLSVILPFLYNPNISWIEGINIIMSGRLRLAAKFLNVYKINFFGNSIDMTGYDNVLDMSLPYILLVYGVIFFVLFFVFYYILCWFCFNKKMYMVIIYLNFFCFIGISELIMINPSYNFSIFFFTLLMGNTIKVKNIDMVSKIRCERGK